MFPNTQRSRLMENIQKVRLLPPIAERQRVVSASPELTDSQNSPEGQSNAPMLPPSNDNGDEQSFPTSNEQSFPTIGPRQRARSKIPYALRCLDDYNKKGLIE